MGQQQPQQGKCNYVFSFDARKAFDTAPHGALHLILHNLHPPPEVIDLLRFLHTNARLRIAIAHTLTRTVHMLRGRRQGNPESPKLYALLLEPLLWALGHRLRLPGEAERGLIEAYILAHANCTLFFTSRAAFVCKKKTRSFRVFPPQN